MIHFLYFFFPAQIIIHDGAVFIVDNCRTNYANDYRFSERKCLLFLLMVRPKPG